MPLDSEKLNNSDSVFPVGTFVRLRNDGEHKGNFRPEEYPLIFIVVQWHEGNSAKIYVSCSSSLTPWKNGWYYRERFERV